nr:protein FAR1-RELATED SEQUENCE 5-like [Ziziphus jujuba var. spinosa]
MSVEQLEANSDCRQVEDISLLSHSKSVDDVYIPQVVENYKPKVGQEFESIDGAHEFYIKYAKEAGFSIHSNSTKTCKGTNEVVMKEFVFFKEGVSFIKDGERKRCWRMTRENCKVKLAVFMSKIGKFAITIFVEEHSHPLSTPRRVHLSRSHRSVSEAKESLTL